MNNGAFGENFPYSNFHDLNMDWIIKIAKDFLDQYSNIQNTITEGVEQLQNTTTEGVEQLQNTATELEGLLNQWYENHSEDITNELLTAINTFRTTANQIGLDVISTIPEDYTELSNNVKARSPFVFISEDSYKLKKDDFIQGASSNNMYEKTDVTYRIRTQMPIHVQIGDKYIVKYNSTVAAGFFARYDEDGTYIADRDLYEGEWEINWNGYIVPVFRKADLSTITPSDFDADITLVPNFINDIYFDYQIIPNNYVNHRCFSTVTKEWYTEGNLNIHSAIMPLGTIKNIKIVRGYANRNTPIVSFFSSDTPSASSYLGGYGLGTEATPELIENIDVTIPNGATHIIIQGYTYELNTPIVTKTTTIKEYAEMTDTKIDETHRIKYEIENDSITMQFKYGEGIAEINFGRRGVNMLPDFRDIEINGVSFYAGHTDWIPPYMVGAVNNINGDDTENHTFTGGNHNYNNVGGTGASATAENLYINFYADGQKVLNGYSGYCNKIRVEWKNNVQAYNTRKADGTGRNVLTEVHIMEFDGETFSILADIEPLENVIMEKWYGYQAYIANWGTTYYIGGLNRRSNNIATASSSLNAKPNGAINKDANNNKLIMEVDRTLDIGDGSLYSGENGMFTNGNKIYFFIIENQNLGYNKHYYLKGSYRFIP